MSRKRKFEEIEFTDQEQQNISDINPGKFESNLKSCLIRLKKNRLVTRFCKKILYLTGMSSPKKSYEFNYSLSQYSKLQSNLGKVITILYLLYKNSEDCFVFNKPLNKTMDFLNLESDDLTNPTDVISYYIINYEKNQTYTSHTSFPPNFKQQINKCDNKRFTLMFLAHDFITFMDNEDFLDHVTAFIKKSKKYTTKDAKLVANDFKFYKFCKKSKGSEGHQNCLIIDNKKKTIERFEPHGSESSYNMEQYDKGLISALMDKLDLSSMAMYSSHPNGHPDSKYTYISPIDFCPSDGLQVMEDSDPLNTKLDFEGYCYMWSVFYMEMRMTKPDIPRDVLIKKTIQVINDKKGFNFKDYIYDYIYFHSFIINTVENLLKSYSSKTNFNLIPNSFIYLVVTTKIKELAKNYSSAIFQHDVTIKSKSTKSHLSKLQDYVSEKIGNIFLEKSKINSDIVRSFHLPVDLESYKPPTKKQRIKKGGGKIRKHSGINQQTGRLKKGYKYSGKKLKSGLPKIIKITKGGGLKFKQRGPSEKKYANCLKQGCSTKAMPFCCPTYSPAKGYCRKDHDGCMKTGMKMSKRKANLSSSALKKLRDNIPPEKIGRFYVSKIKDEELTRDNAGNFLAMMLKQDKERTAKANESAKIIKQLSKRSKPIPIPKRKKRGF